MASFARWRHSTLVDANGRTRDDGQVSRSARVAGRVKGGLVLWGWVLFSDEVEDEARADLRWEVDDAVEDFGAEGDGREAESEDDAGGGLVRQALAIGEFEVELQASRIEDGGLRDEVA
jgi:hypothetical protein